jgi:hypothetical protein
VFVAWGLSNGQFTPQSLVERARDAGYEWVALELDDYGGWQMWPAFRAAAAGYVKAGVWVTEGRNIQFAPNDCEFAIAELEGPGDYEGILAAEASGQIPNVPKAVITNFNVPLTDPSGVPQPAAAKPLIDAGYVCLTEAYLGDNPNANPDRLDFRAKQLGWSTSQPVFGVYNKPLAEYAQWFGWPGAVYLAEYIL